MAALGWDGGGGVAAVTGKGRMLARSSAAPWTVCRLPPLAVEQGTRHDGPAAPDEEAGGSLSCARAASYRRVSLLRGSRSAPDDVHTRHTRPHPSTPVHTRPTLVHTRPHSSALAPYSSHARLLWLGLPEPTSRNTRGAHIDMAICHAGRDGQVWGASAGSSPIHFRHLPDRMGPRVCP